MEDIVSAGLAKKLQTKGFPLRQVVVQDGSPIFFDLPMDHPEWHQCDAWYLPTVAQVLKWLREEKKIHVCVDIYEIGWYFEINKNITFNYETFDYDIEPSGTEYYESYNDAVLMGIEYVLDNLIQ